MSTLSRGAFVAGTLAATAAARIPARAATTYTRYSIYQIMTNCSLTPYLTAYEVGVKAMMALSPNDPRSWIYQANIHGTTAKQLQTSWNTCQHGSYFFFSWHRMYLYYFERIVRAMSGYSAFALPFWDYTNGLISGDSESVLPAAFRDPATSLYTSNRNSGVNAGSPLPSSAIANASSLAVVPFSSGGPTNYGFGGSVPNPDVPGQFYGAYGAAEQQPHNVVHDAIGGLMGNIVTAAQDPIFYLHHANIDRMWTQWWDGSPQTHDPSDSTWLNTRFTFFNENAQAVVMTGAQVQNSVNLGIQYGPTTPVSSSTPLCPGASVSPRVRATKSLDSVLSREASPQMKMVGPAAALGVKLIAAVVTIRVIPTFSVGSLKPDTRVFLRIDGIEYDQSPGYYYEIYLNLPAGVNPDYRSQYFVGNLSFFGAFMHKNGKMVNRPQVNDITEIVQSQIKSGTWAGTETITMIRQGANDPGRGKWAPIANTRISSVVITDRYR